MLTIDEDKPGNRLNDGKCDAKGRLWAGTFGQSTGGVAGVDPKKGSVFKIGPLSGLISRVFWNSGYQPLPDTTMLTIHPANAHPKNQIKG